MLCQSHTLTQYSLEEKNFQQKLPEFPNLLNFLRNKSDYFMTVEDFSVAVIERDLMVAFLILSHLLHFLLK